MHIFNEKINIIKKELITENIYFCVVLIALLRPFETLQPYRMLRKRQLGLELNI